MRVVGGKTGTDGRLFAYIVWTVPAGPAEKGGLQQGDKVCLIFCYLFFLVIHLTYLWVGCENIFHIDFSGNIQFSWKILFFRYN